MCFSRKDKKQMFHLTNVFWDLVETGVIVPIQTMHYVGGKSPNFTIDSIRFALSLIPQNWVPFHKVADLSPIHFRKQSRKWYLRILNIGFQGLALIQGQIYHSVE